MRRPVLVLLLTCGSTSPMAQTVGGTTGLLTVPTASMPPDGSVAVGASLLHRRYQDYRSGEYHLVPIYLQLGFSPFLEVDLRLTRTVGFPQPQALGDRMVSVRARLLREGRVAPAVVVGVHDPLTSTEKPTNHFNALYLVASKTVTGPPLVGDVGLHLGYGSDAMAARYHTFVGPFGGVSVHPGPAVEGMLEHDGHGVNVGIRVHPHSALSLTVGLERFATVSGGVRLRARLPRGPPGGRRQVLDSSLSREPAALTIDPTTHE